MEAMPMLIEDLKNSDVPLSFQKVHKASIEKGIVSDKNDELIILLHILMLESGFVLKTSAAAENSEESSVNFHYTKFLTACDKIPNNWKKSVAHYEILYVLPPFNQNVCKLVCSPNADDVLINCIVDNIDDAYYCMIIDPSLYIMTSTTKLHHKFQNMQHLSRTFKSTISNYAKVTILKHNNVGAVCLEDMPPEILMNVAQHFCPKTLAMFEATCVYFRKVSNDPSLWRKITDTPYDTFQHFKKAERSKSHLKNGNRFDFGRTMHSAHDL